MRFFAELKLRLMQSPIAYRLARGAFWSLLGGMVSRLLAMISSIIVARFLGKEGYGEMGMVQSTMGMFGVFAGFGLGSTATKYISEFRCKDPVKAGRIASLTLIVSIVSAAVIMVLFASLSPSLAKSTLNRSALSPLLLAGSLLLFVSTLFGVLSAILSAFESFREIAKINICQGLCAPLITIPLVLLYGVQGAIASFTVTASIGLLLCARAVRTELAQASIEVRYDSSLWREWGVLWKFSLPSMVSALMVGPVTWVTNTILANQVNGYGELGLYNVANQWGMLVSFVPTLLCSAVLPVLSETHGREDQSDFISTVTLNFHVTWIVSLPLTILAVSIGKLLVIFYGKQYLGAASIIPILMVSTFLNVLNGSIGSALVGTGRIWTGTVMNAGWAASLVLAALFLVPRFGGVGLALANLSAYFLHTAWVMCYVERNLAPTAIMKHMRLLLFSVLLLTVSLITSRCDGAGAISFHTLLFALSLAPLLLLLIKTKRKVCGNEQTAWPLKNSFDKV